MMKRFPRHPINNIPFIARRLEKYNDKVDESLQLVLQRPHELLGSEFNQVLNLVGVSMVADRPHAETIGYMRLALALGFANFQSALHPGEPLFLPFCGENLPFTGAATTAYTDPITWAKLFYLSVILRENETTDALITIPESLMQQANLKADEVDFAIMRFLKGIYDPSVNIGELLLNALNLTNPETNKEERIDYLLYLKAPELYLYACIFNQQPQEFNEELFKALVAHQKYWTDEECGGAYNPQGWLSYPLLTASAIAYGAKHFPITVDSDYTPLWLIRGEFE